MRAHQLLSAKAVLVALLVTSLASSGRGHEQVPLSRIRWPVDVGSPEELLAWSEQVDWEAVTRPLALWNIGNVQYVGTVELGTPGQMVKVIFDTGSSDLWVPQTRFRPHLSLTLHCPDGQGCDEEVTIKYSVGQIVGKLAMDKLTIGGCSIPNQAFVLASTVGDLGNHFFDGVLGLAFPTLSHTGTTVLTQLMGEASLAVFSFLLKGSGDDSLFMLGMPMEGSFDSRTLVYTPVVLQEWWTFKGALAVGDVIIAEHSYFALDTGTSYLTLPAAYFKALLKEMLPEDQRQLCKLHKLTTKLVCPCSAAAFAHTVYIVVGNRRFPIFPEAIFTPSRETSIDASAWAVDDKHPTQCILEVQPADVALPFILGDTFLRTVVAIFDTTNLRIGLAQQVDYAPALPETKARLRRDATSPFSGPLLSPHLPQQSSDSLTLLMLLSAVLAGVVTALIVSMLCHILDGMYLKQPNARRLHEGVGNAPNGDGLGAGPQAPLLVHVPEDGRRT